MTSVRDDQFNSFANQQINDLQILNFSTLDETRDYLEQSQEIDFWLIFNESGSIVASSGTSNQRFSDIFAAITADTLSSQNPLHSNELTTLATLGLFDDSLVKQASFPGLEADETPVMMKIATVPLAFLDEGSQPVVVLVGRICNNDPYVFGNLSALAPNYYAALSASDGLRLSGNFVHQISNGEYQNSEVVRTIQSGTRGYVVTNAKDTSFLSYSAPVVCDPIRNYAGEIIGGFTFGYSEDEQVEARMMILLCLVVFSVLIFAFGTLLSFYISKKVTVPIDSLSNVAKDIAKKGLIDESHILKSKTILEQQTAKNHHIKECYDLNLGMQTMLDSLCESQKETKHYIATLQETNGQLEVLVDNRTLELRAAMEKARESSILKSKFMANISHDIRTPLNSVIGFSDLMLEELYGSLNENQKEYLRIINSSAEDVLAFFNDLLSFSVLEQGKLALKKDWVSIERLLSEIISQSEARLKTTNIKVTLDAADDLPDVYADGHRLRQAMSNIYDNALKFTGDNGCVYISAKAGDDEKLIIQISDNGMGIEPAELGLVFEEFYQVEDTYQKFHPGIGLGLPVAMNLVQLHNGSIDISSTPGVGTMVTIILPIDNNDENESSLNRNENKDSENG